MSKSELTAAIAKLGGGPLSPETVGEHIAPLFSRALAGDRQRGEIYLANHSLGRPPDRMEEDVRRGLELWYSRMDECWNDDLWPAEIGGFRSRIAKIIGHPDPTCVIPKSSAGQGLRAVLNALWGSGAGRFGGGEAPSFFEDRERGGGGLGVEPSDQGRNQARALQIVTTRGEFDSIDFILKQYEAKGLARVTWVEPNRFDQGIPLYDAADISGAIGPESDLAVVSLAMFATGQILLGIEQVIQRAHDVGALVVLDVYHSAGVIPLDFMALNADFFIGGSYKYLRGGPGACWLAIHPRVIESGLSTLDTGWFAKRSPFRYERPDPPQFAEGGDAWMESTPAVMAAYQAASGQEFTLSVGVERIRKYSLEQQAFLRDQLRANGLLPYEPAEPKSFGGFSVLPIADSSAACAALKKAGLNTDTRGGCIRFGPDLLTTFEELERSAKIAGELLRP